MRRPGTVFLGAAVTHCPCDRYSFMQNQNHQERTTLSQRFDDLVVGAGFAGAVMAERLASQLGRKVLVIDKRDHIAGNAFDYFDDAGVLIHKYGPHIFHTNSAKVYDYLSQFTDWLPYEHKVLASVGGLLVPVPINRTTVNKLYGLSLASDADCQAYFDSVSVPIDELKTSEDSVIAKVGPDLYEKLFRGYTRKQWELDPRDLHASVTARIPVRTNDDDRYFTDKYQEIPAEGYTAMFGRMLSHRNIEVRTGVDFFDCRDALAYDHLVWTGPIDAYFDNQFGPLPYRSLEFEMETIETPGGELVFPVAQINEPCEDVPYTRRTEFRHITGQLNEFTTIATEFSCSSGDPYYPIPRDSNRRLFKRYRALADRLEGVTFVGRLANYQYLNMDQVTAQALSTFEKVVAEGTVLASDRTRFASH